MKLGATLATAALFALALVTSSSWTGGPRIVVMVVAIPGLLLTALEIAGDLRRRRAPAVATGTTEGGTASADSASGAGSGRDTQFVLWLLGYLVASWLFGLAVSSTVFTLAYLRAITRKSWVFSIISAAIVYFFIWYVVQDIFMSTLPDPAVMYWF